MWDDNQAGRFVLKKEKHVLSVEVERVWDVDPQPKHHVFLGVIQKHLTFEVFCGAHRGVEGVFVIDQSYS